MSAFGGSGEAGIGAKYFWIQAFVCAASKSPTMTRTALLGE